MKRETENFQIQVGAFVAVGLLLLMMVIFMLGGEKRIFDSQYNLNVQFDDISGLREGAPVQLAGIAVGSVSRITFDDQLESKKIRVSLDVSKSFQNRIREDSKATIATQGLLGDKLVLITVGSAEERVLKDGDNLKTGRPVGFDILIEKGDDIINDVHTSIKSLNTILDAIKDGKGLVHQMVFNESGEKAFNDLAQMATNLNETTENINDISSKINRGEGTLGALVNDATLFNDMKTLMGKANRNKLIRSVIRYTLKTKEEKMLEK